MAQRYLTKGEMRQRDADDIASGRRTREEVQEENSLFPGEVIRAAIIHPPDPAEYAAAAEEFVRWSDSRPRL